MVAHALGLPVGLYLKSVTHRQHRATLEWLQRQQNVPSRSDWHVIRAGWWQLDPKTRPPLGELGKLFGDGAPEPEGPYPRFTRETAAAARAAVQRFHLTKQGAKFLGD